MLRVYWFNDTAHEILARVLLFTERSPRTTGESLNAWSNTPHECFAICRSNGPLGIVWCAYLFTRIKRRSFLLSQRLRLAESLSTVLEYKKNRVIHAEENFYVRSGGIPFPDRILKRKTGLLTRPPFLYSRKRTFLRVAWRNLCGEKSMERTEREQEDAKTGLCANMRTWLDKITREILKRSGNVTFFCGLQRWQRGPRVFWSFNKFT